MPSPPPFFEKNGCWPCPVLSGTWRQGLYHVTVSLPPRPNLPFRSRIRPFPSPTPPVATSFRTVAVSPYS